jgi:predicted transcriptional regulator
VYDTFPADPTERNFFMKSPLLSVRIPETLAAELTSLAKEKKVSKSALVRDALAEYKARNVSDASTPEKEDAHA